MEAAPSFGAFCGDEPFWDFSLSWNTTDPDFTTCFEHTALTWIPCGFLFLLTPPLAHALVSSKEKPLRWTKLLSTKIALFVLLALNVTVELALTIALSDSTLADIAAAILLLISSLDLLVLAIFCKKRGIITSGTIFTSLVLFTICSGIEFRSRVRRLFSSTATELETAAFAVYATYFILVAVELVLYGFADQPSRNRKRTALKKPCPEQASSFLSQCTFWWFTPLVVQGYKKSLTTKDLWRINDEDTSPTLVPKWEKYWSQTMKTFQRYGI